MGFWMFLCLLFTIVGAGIVAWFIREYKSDESALVEKN